MSACTTTAICDALRIANAIRKTLELDTSASASVVKPREPSPALTTTPIVDLASFPSPDPLAPQLVEIGLPPDAATSMSNSFMKTAEELKARSEKILRSAYSKLSTIDNAHLDKIQTLLYKSHHKCYEATLSQWEQEVKALVRSRLTAISSEDPHIPKMSKLSSKKLKRKFKTEYLPLFEFAFEKDRFPNREDKKHLAKISGMSYRQVCVWFQNRRCRYASRVKSHHFTPPPQSFEEMKDRLNVFARGMLLNAPFPKQEAHCALDPDSPGATPPALEGPVTPLICSLMEKKVTLPRSNEQASSVRASEISEETFDPEERDPLEDDSDVVLPGTFTSHTLTTFVPIHSNDAIQLTPLPSTSSRELPPASTNPPNPFTTSTAGVFPAVYKPSKLTSDPFVVVCQPWLWPRGPRTRQVLGLTAETLEHITEEFDKMDVDVSTFDYDDSAVTCNEPVERLSKPSPRSNIATPSHRAPPNLYPSVQRTVSSSSSGSLSSCGLGPMSRSSSHSTVASSVLSSPHRSDTSLLSASACAIEVPSDYAASPSTAWRPFDEGYVCDTPIDDEVAVAGSLSSMKPISKARVDAWMLDVSKQQENDAAIGKWEQLLSASAAAGAEPPGK